MAAKQYFRASETFHCAESGDVPILRGDVLPGDNPVVVAHPAFFVNVDVDNERNAERWETATSAPAVSPRQAPKRSPKRSEE